VPASPRAGWGWHRLTESWAETIVATARVQPGDLVLDIGAGTGALTGPLVRAGARVIAVELHPGRAAALRERFATAPVTVVPVDARDLRLPRRPFRVVANPPYSVTAPLLRRLLARGSRLAAADLVLQRAVVRRWTNAAAPGANRWARSFVAEPGLAVPRRAFQPRPHVDSEVLCIRRR
jgi:23S rRNA (adenine-N6)-dimethyltransferase